MQARHHAGNSYITHFLLSCLDLCLWHRSHSMPNTPMTTGRIAHMKYLRVGCAADRSWRSSCRLPNWLSNWLRMQRYRCSWRSWWPTPLLLWLITWTYNCYVGDSKSQSEERGGWKTVKLQHGVESDGRTGQRAMRLHLHALLHRIMACRQIVQDQTRSQDAYLQVISQITQQCLQSVYAETCTYRKAVCIFPGYSEIQPAEPTRWYLLTVRQHWILPEGLVGISSDARNSVAAVLLSRNNTYNLGSLLPEWC